MCRILRIKNLTDHVRVLTVRDPVARGRLRPAQQGGLSSSQDPRLWPHTSRVINDHSTLYSYPLGTKGHPSSFCTTKDDRLTSFIFIHEA